MISITQCETEKDRVAALRLMAELGQWDSAETQKLGFNADDVLDFYYTSDNDALNGILPPSGVTLLGHVGTDVAGCIAYRTLTATACEMKRLFVSPEFRASGLGRVLISSLIDHARQAGFACMRLETVVFMHGAMRIYEEMGFVRCPPYYEIPEIFGPITIFMEKDLTPSAPSSTTA